MQLLPTKRTIERVAAPSGSGAAKGMEFSMVLVAFFGIGWVVDRLLGTAPLFTIVIGVLGVVGQFARVWYAYDAEMTQHETRRRQHEQQIRAGGPAS